MVQPAAGESFPTVPPPAESSGVGELSRSPSIPQTNPSLSVSRGGEDTSDQSRRMSKEADSVHMAVRKVAADETSVPDGSSDSGDGANSLAGRSGVAADEALRLAIAGGRAPGEPDDVDRLLLEQLLASFSNQLGRDPELSEWKSPPYSECEKRRVRVDPKRPFFLFKLKASAKTAQISWWKKRYSRFPPERAGYTAALRVARLVVGEDGFRLEQAGEDGQPGAVSCAVDEKYSGWPRPKVGIFLEGSSVPLREVGVIKRLPGGDGISIMSYVNGLGIKLGDILFVMPYLSCKVALSFTEREFYVSSRFKEEPLYGRVGLDFVDITYSVEKLIKKLYKMYQQEQDEKIAHELRDQEYCQENEELMRQQEEQERNRIKDLERRKLEDLQRRRAESRKYKNLRNEMKEMVRQMKMPERKEEELQPEEYNEAFSYMFASKKIQLDETMEQLCQREEG